MSRNKQPYLVEGKIVPIETFCKNYQIIMNSQYIVSIREASMERILNFEESLIWQLIVNYNKFEIVSKEEYL